MRARFADGVFCFSPLLETYGWVDLEDGAESCAEGGAFGVACWGEEG